MHPQLGSVIVCVALFAATGCAWLPAQLTGFARSDAKAVPARSDSRPSATFYYIVERGDTLSRIAPRLGTSVGALVRENQLSDPDRLEIGQRLAVPANATWTIGKPRMRAPVSAPPPDVAVAAPRAATSDAAWRAEEVSVRVEDSTLLAVDCALIGADERLRSAHFEEALDEARAARTLLGSVQSEPGAAERGVRADVLVAMAEVALGNDEAARESFARALDADPGLTLAPSEVSPKILRLLDETRQQVELRQASR